MSFFFESKFLTDFYQFFKPFLNVELEITFQFLQANWAKDSYSPSLLIGAVDAIHQALIVNAVVKSEHVADFVGHDMAGIHKQVFFSIFVFYAVKCRIISHERKDTSAASVTSPSENITPTIARV